MDHPLQITFRHMEVSPAIESRIQKEVAALEHFFNRINRCRVVIEAPHRDHQRGRAVRVTIDLQVPGSRILVNHQPSAHNALAKHEAGEWTKDLEIQPDHKDIYVCIRDAFAAARRRLEDYVRILRGDIKHHTGEAEVL